MVNGTVKFFNRTNHYGFIDGEDGKSYFVHQTGLKEGVSIDEGDKVSFKAVEGDKGPKAEEVEKLEEGQEAGEDTTADAEEAESDVVEFEDASEEEELKKAA